MLTTNSHTVPSLLLACASLAVVGCGGLDEFEITESARAQIQGADTVAGLSGDLGFDGFDSISIAESQEIQNQGVDPDEIDSIRVSTLSLEAISPDSGDLAFLESLEFYVESDGLERRRIARGGPYADGQSVAMLELDDVNLAPYASAESMTISTEATGTQPDQTTTIESTLTLVVDVDVTGLVTP